MSQVPDPNEYKDEYSEPRFWNKLARYARKAGLKAVYGALLLFYAFKRKDTPLWAKNIVLGVLGYFLAPIDLIPDLTPFLGYTDDLGVLGFGLTAISMYINDEVRAKARTRLRAWFPDPDEDMLTQVDERI